MMTCTQILQLLSQRADGTTSPADELLIDAHLADCSACRDNAAVIAELSRQMRAYGDDVRSSKTNIACSAIQAWQQEQPRAASWRSGKPARMGAVAAAAAALAAIYLALNHTPTGPKEGHSSLPDVATVKTGQQSNPISLPGGSNTRISDIGVPFQRSGVGSGQRGHALFTSAGPIANQSPVAPVNLLPTDDIQYVNYGVGSVPGRWARLLPDENTRLQQELMKSVKGGDDFVTVPLPRLAGISSSSMAAARRAWQQEKAVVDSRLVRKVTAGVKGMSFADLCKQWKDETGIEFSANRTVADDKITLFCKDKPLRDIMRQITQVFGFGWRRSGEPDKYQYELYQDLRSQLIEEELRNKDRNEALVDLDKEMEKFRKFLNLSPAEARAAAETAGPEDKQILEQLGGTGWAAAHLYFGLSGEQMGALRSGQKVQFDSSPQSGQYELPSSMRSGVLNSMPNAHVVEGAGGGSGLIIGGTPPPNSNPRPISDFPNARTNASLQLNANDLGQIEMDGGAGFGLTTGDGNNQSSMAGSMSNTMAVGASPSVKNPENAKANKDLARDQALSHQIQSAPESKYQSEATRNRESGPRLTSADVLEALYNKTGMDIVSDYYSRLYEPNAVAVNGKSLFDALNRSCDAMRVRWTKTDGWLRFRSASFYNDRLKEIPNRFLTQWQTSRKANKFLTAEDLTQIASLTDIQLNATSVGEAVKAIYGLKEWNFAASSNIREHWRFLSGLVPSLRKTALSGKPLVFSQLPVIAQQKYIGLTLSEADRNAMKLADMADATLTVEFPYPAKEDGATTAADTGEPQPDVRFTYNYGSANTGKFIKKISPNGTSVNMDNGKDGQRKANAREILKRTMP